MENFISLTQYCRGTLLSLLSIAEELYLVYSVSIISQPLWVYETPIILLIQQAQDKNTEP